MKRDGMRYDADLQMFVEPPKPLDLNRLAFLRHLAERGHFEHDVAGPPSGPLAEPESPGDQTATS